jgi:hypothetical protein
MWLEWVLVSLGLWFCPQLWHLAVCKGPGPWRAQMLLCSWTVVHGSGHLPSCQSLGMFLVWSRVECSTEGAHVCHLPVLSSWGKRSLVSVLLPSGAVLGCSQSDSVPQKPSVLPVDGSSAEFLSLWNHELKGNPYCIVCGVTKRGPANLLRARVWPVSQLLLLLVSC